VWIWMHSDNQTDWASEQHYIAKAIGSNPLAGLKKTTK